MGLDTKYRPATYDEVIGQDSTIDILKNYVKSGSGFHQSYLFFGPHGTGKTTLARILSRSILCREPTDGIACDKCPSCLSILSNRSSDCYFEIDAATNSGKEFVAKIIEEIKYDTFSGGHRIYVFDEAHRLSSSAVDALLKVMEDTVPDSHDKLLVCIFCTTEPDKMRPAVVSRCAPSFEVKKPSTEDVANRLAHICFLEHIEYEDGALPLIADTTRCHLRDAVKTLESISLDGPVTVQAVVRHQQLDKSQKALEILSLMGSDLPRALAAVESITSISPTTMYEELAAMSMAAFRHHLAPLRVPGYVDDKLFASVSSLGNSLLAYAQRFSSRPNRPTMHMLMCDIAYLSVGPQIIDKPLSVPTISIPSLSVPPLAAIDQSKVDDKPRLEDDVYVHPRAVNHKEVAVVKKDPTDHLKPAEFFRLVKLKCQETRSLSGGGDAGHERPDDMGGT